MSVHTIGKLRGSQVLQAMNYMEIGLFRYFPKERMIVNEAATCGLYECREVYREAPESFIREMVWRDDIKAAVELYRLIDDGAEGATEDFRVGEAGARWCRVTITVTERDGEGRPVETVGMIEDVTEEKAREKEAFNALLVANQDKNERMESILFGISGGFAICLDDSCSTFDYCSEEAAAIQGYTVEELLEQCNGCLRENIYSRDRETVEEELARQYEAGGTYKVRYRVKHKDGRLIWIMDSGRRVVREDGSVRDYRLWQDVTEEMRKNEQLYSTVQAFQIAAANSGDVLFIFDAEKQSILVSDTHARQFGVLAEQSGVPYETARRGIVTEDTREEYIRLHECIMNGEKEAEGVVSLVSADGATGIYELRLSALLDEEGQPTGKAVGMYKDITRHYLLAQEQKRSLQDLREEYKLRELRAKEESLRQMEAIYALSSEYYGIFQIDVEENTFVIIRQEGTYPMSILGQPTYEGFFWNYCMERMCGEDREVMLRFADRDYLRAQLQNRNFLSLEFRNPRGLWRRGRFVVESRDAQGTVKDVLFVVQIIDEEKRRELEHQQELKQAYEAANRANVAKTRFLSNMSHDIRTPMNAVIGFASIAASHPENVERVKDCLSKILNSSEHLLGLINEILDMSRIESGKTMLELDAASMDGIVDSVVSLIQPQAQEKQLHFTVDTAQVQGDYVCADALKIRQVLTNILGNAVKYTNEGGEIALCVTKTAAEKEGFDKYCFIVKDTGIGMSEDFQEHIFEPFERERNTTVSGIAGTGLGMPITKSLVDMMGGDITFVSARGKGTEFRISLELKREEDGPKESGAAEETENSSFSGNHVLVVEDYDLNREIASALLTEMGLAVDTAYDGKNALEILNASAPGDYQLVLMDIQMPVMNGYEATMEIRNLDREDIRNLPIVAMTANAFAEDVQAARMAGMNDHLAKPLDMKKVVSTLHKYLK